MVNAGLHEEQGRTSELAHATQGWRHRRRNRGSALRRPGRQV